MDMVDRIFIVSDMYSSMDCICGKKYTNSNKCRHFRTAHHQQYIRQIDQNFVDRLDREMNELILTEIRRKITNYQWARTMEQKN